MQAMYDWRCYCLVYVVVTITVIINCYYHNILFAMNFKTHIHSFIHSTVHFLILQSVRLYVYILAATLDKKDKS